MDFSLINARGLVLLGCGKMGSAMLAGWLDGGLHPDAVHVIDPAPSDWLRDTGVRLNGDLPDRAAVAVIAVKPQMMGDALPQLRSMGRDTLFLSIAAGTSIAAFADVFGPQAAIVRAMPNTPAAIGRGITAMIGNGAATAAQCDMAEGILRAVGDVVRLQDEAQIDAVTGLSGSGPAYVFYMIDCLAQAGVAQGLSPDLAMQLAKATVAGAGALAMQDAQTPTQLRVNVTSPNGTTQAGLEVLMDPVTGLAPLAARTVAAATARSRALKG
jgi:pyrroline-5-carboxylate reductase